MYSKTLFFLFISSDHCYNRLNVLVHNYLIEYSIDCWAFVIVVDLISSFRVRWEDQWSKVGTGLKDLSSLSVTFRGTSQLSFDFSFKRGTRFLHVHSVSLLTNYGDYVDLRGLAMTRSILIFNIILIIFQLQNDLVLGAPLNETMYRLNTTGNTFK